ncbi:hypothetical protein FAGAP_9365, partial [Fusarium agapanthi]
REHAAIRDAGISKLFKHAAITIKYNMDLREGIFGASSTGSDAPFWAHYCEANELPYLPKYAEYGRVANVRRNINKKFGFASSWNPERLRVVALWKGLGSGEKVEGLTGCRDEDDYEEQEEREAGQIGDSEKIVRDEDDYEEREEGQIVRDEGDYEEQEWINSNKHKLSKHFT